MGDVWKQLRLFVCAKASIILLQPLVWYMCICEKRVVKHHGREQLLMLAMCDRGLAARMHSRNADAICQLFPVCSYIGLEIAVRIASEAFPMVHDKAYARISCKTSSDNSMPLVIGITQSILQCGHKAVLLLSTVAILSDENVWQQK